MRGGRPENWNFVKAAEPAEKVSGTSLFCFAVHMDTYSFEQDLIDRQVDDGLGIWACDAHLLVDGLERLPGGLRDVGVVARGYPKIWERIRDDGQYKAYDWTVKTELDAVFVPSRLVRHLTLLRPPAGASLFLKSSREWTFGAALKVLSKSAIWGLMDYLHECVDQLKTFGEDVFLTSCLEAHAVGVMVDYKLERSFSNDSHVAGGARHSVYTSACYENPWVAFYPVQEPTVWASCYKTAKAMGIQHMSLDEGGGGDSSGLPARMFESQGRVAGRRLLSRFVVSAPAFCGTCVLAAAMVVFWRSRRRREHSERAGDLRLLLAMPRERHEADEDCE